MKPGFTPADGNFATAEAVIAAGLTVRLYAAAHAPALEDTIASFTELAVLGYGPVGLSSSRDAWRLELASGGGVLATYRDEVLWRFALYGPTVFGYLFTLGGRVLGVQEFEKPWPIQNRGDSLAIAPAIVFGPPAPKGGR